jgi:NhaP-type Na+/H+ or K+/H+ antiporter
LTIGLGALIAAVLFDQLDAGEVAILAIVLAPTDAALGEAVVTEPRLPSRIRQGLNVESGLNDGICVPLLLIALAVASVEGDQSTGADAVSVIAQEIGYGVLGDAAAGVFSAELLLRAGRRQLITPLWRQAVPLAGAALAYGLTPGLGGSGFHCGDRRWAHLRPACRRPHRAVSRFTEGLSALLGGITFLVLGAVLLGPSLEHIDWRIALYAVLGLTVARWPTLAFLGWFGPRGLASISP